MNVPLKNSLSAMLKALLLVSAALVFTAAQAQDEASDDTTAEAAEDAKELGKVVITGSRIARTEVEGPSPVIIIDREQIEREGFTTVQDALKSLSQASGVVQNELFTGGFTNNANSIGRLNIKLNNWVKNRYSATKERPGGCGTLVRQCLGTPN